MVHEKKVERAAFEDTRDGSITWSKGNAPELQEILGTEQERNNQKKKKDKFVTGGLRCSNCTETWPI
ncbi:hypothetical protein NECAME_03255 [Necator americanus]|uniref:Uncharacterized protein n=1 Tax=Necator americanus TaxID=51031 RepID=W2T547_NECAM|nr:hypothetical protein NECAME_03255 [Necator americanus]ETN77155.1 hypothetical protein NECAME_03255 [Necator americanus]